MIYRSTDLLLIASLLLLSLACAGNAGEASEANTSPQTLDKLPYSVYKRTVFLGDSVTDGNTYPSLVADALRQAGHRRMLAINAGVGGNTSGQMAARLDRDVLSQHPSLVTFSAGSNDASTKVTPEQYEENVRSIIVRLQDEKIPLILLTNRILPPNLAPEIADLYAHYDASLRRLAGEFHLRLAEVGERMKEDAAAGHTQLSSDARHPGYQGQRIFARAVLDAMGYAKVPVPERLHASLLPGVITPWQMRAVVKGEAPLTEQTVSALTADESWITLKLPLTTPITGDDNLWLDDYRQQGLATNLHLLMHSDVKRYLGIATMHIRSRRTINLHTGAELGKVWLNGECVYKSSGLTGWHAGRDSVSVNLIKGENRLVIETGANFFLSMTKDSFWK